MRADDRAAPVCAAGDIAPGTIRPVTVDGVPVALVRTADGTLHAVHDECTHARVRLSDGELADSAVECALHGSRFDLVTGRPRNLPATAAVRVYPVEVREDNIYVNVKQGDMR